MAVVFIAAIRLVCLLDDDSHRVLSHMKGNAHRPSPLSESRNSRQACCALHPTPCGAMLFYRRGAELSRIRKRFQLCALGPVGPCTCAARPGRSLVRRGFPRPRFVALCVTAPDFRCCNGAEGEVVRFAVPGESFVLTLILRFSDRYSNPAMPFSATGSGIV